MLLATGASWEKASRSARLSIGAEERDNRGVSFLLAPFRRTRADRSGTTDGDRGAARCTQVPHQLALPVFSRPGMSLGVVSWQIHLRQEFP